MQRMRRALRYVFFTAVGFIAAFALGVLWPEPVLKPVRSSGPIAIRDVAVVDVETGRIVAGQTVVVHGGRITAVGPTATTSIPAGATMIAGRGHYLMPALADMHVHVTALAPLLDLPLYIRFGVTTVRDMLGCPKVNDPFIACPEDKRRWSAEAIDGLRVGPRIVGITSFMANGSTTLDRVRGVPPFFGTRTPDEARAFVRHFADRVDAIKVYDRISRPAYLALVDEAQRHGLDVVGHRPHAVSAIEAAGHMKSLEHARFLLHEGWPGREAMRERAGTSEWREERARMLAEYDPALAREILDTMAHRGTWYVPTHLTRWVDAYADDPVVLEDSLLRYVHPLLRWQWREDVDATVAGDPSPAGRAAYRAFHEQGLALTRLADSLSVGLLVGTDYIIAGADVHRELEQFVAAGVTPASALRAATLAPAQYLGRAHEQGRMAVGYVADLVLLADDPLRDMRHTRRIVAVLFDGHLYDRAELDGIDAHVRAQARSLTVACKIVWRFIRSPANY